MEGFPVDLSGFSIACTSACCAAVEWLIDVPCLPLLKAALRGSSVLPGEGNCSPLLKGGSPGPAEGPDTGFLISHVNHRGSQ